MSDLINQTQQALITEAINRKQELLSMAIADDLDAPDGHRLDNLEYEDQQEALALFRDFKKRMQNRHK